MIALIIISYILSGILGCIIFNKVLVYQHILLKYIWNFIVFCNGYFGLLISIFVLFIKLIDKIKKDENK